VVTPYDVTHGHLVNVMAHVRQGALDTPIAPRRILFGHLDHKPLDLLGHRWPTTLGAAHASVKLLRAQSFVPAQESLGDGKRDDLFETLTAEGIGKGSKAAAVGVSQAQPAATELGFEDAILFL